jgi:NAD(P)-dependent dehydrogenase (short-subunit alcohol dehydrogenase family)
MATYSDLKGKTFVITGAASGMGRTTCLALAQQGANVGLLDLRKPDDTLKEVEDLGAQGISLACNVQDRKAVHEAVKAVSDKFGGIDGAANMAGYVGNQGLYGKGYALDVIEDEDWDGMLATNLNGVKNCIRAELNFIKDGGSIINAASIAGQYGPAYNAPYSVSKWGVISLTKVAAQEAGKRNVRVNAVAPFVPLSHILAKQNLI